MTTGLIPHGLTPMQIGARVRWAHRRDRFGPSGMPADAVARQRVVVLHALRVRLAKAKQRRTCGKGHRWTPANTRLSTIDPRSGKQRRYCRACDAVRAGKARIAKQTAREMAALLATLIRNHPDKGGRGGRTFRKALSQYQARKAQGA